MRISAAEETRDGGGGERTGTQRGMRITRIYEFRVLYHLGDQERRKLSSLPERRRSLQDMERDRQDVFSRFYSPAFLFLFLFWKGIALEQEPL